MNQVTSLQKLCVVVIISLTEMLIWLMIFMVIFTPSWFDKAAINLLVGDFFIHATIISSCPAWSITTFSDLVQPLEVHELQVDSWRFLSLRQTPYEMVTLPAQGHSDSSIIFCIAGPVYDRDTWWTYESNFMHFRCFG